MRKNNYNIEYLPSYEEELNEILYYFLYKLNNKRAFKNLINRIERAILKRSYNPISFEKYKSKNYRKYEWYRIYIGNFIILYSVSETTMYIAHIFYNKRNLEILI